MKDERIEKTRVHAESLGYRFLWIGIMLIFLYRLIFHDVAAVAEIREIIFLWAAISFFVEGTKSFKGIPLFEEYSGKYPLIAIISSGGGAAVATFLIYLAGVITTFGEIAGQFVRIFFIILALFFLWGLLYRWWEKRSLDN